MSFSSFPVSQSRGWGQDTSGFVEVIKARVESYVFRRGRTAGRKQNLLPLLYHCDKNWRTGCAKEPVHFRSMLYTCAAW